MGVVVGLVVVVGIGSGVVWEKSDQSGEGAAVVWSDQSGEWGGSSVVCPKSVQPGSGVRAVASAGVGSSVVCPKSAQSGSGAEKAA